MYFIETIIKSLISSAIQTRIRIKIKLFCFLFWNLGHTLFSFVFLLRHVHAITVQPIFFENFCTYVYSYGIAASRNHPTSIYWTFFDSWWSPSLSLIPSSVYHNYFITTGADIQVYIIPIRFWQTFWFLLIPYEPYPTISWGIPLLFCISFYEFMCIRCKIWTYLYVRILVNMHVLVWTVLIFFKPTAVVP